MDKKILHKLEYDKIIEMLTERCSSSLGKALARALSPSGDLEYIEERQDETTEAREIVRLHPGFTMGGVSDLHPALRKAESGGIIDPGEFLRLYDTLIAAGRIKKFFSDEGKKYSKLAIYAQLLCNLPGLENRIKKTITQEGEIDDNASKELTRIRKQLRSLQGRAREKLEGMVRSAEVQKYLQEMLITIRNDRYVLPVKQEYRQYVPGLVHDQSASGATLFIEPMAVVEVNNEVQRYEAMERTEVIRILRELTALVESHRQELLDMLEALALLDFIMARGKLSAELDCGQPLLNDRGRIKIIQGRHPLIRGEVVPITINLGFDFDALVITGPNTGGKTVTLKTVGLFTLMAQAGLHVPAQTGTEVAVFRKVYADIGDEQSIEQSLSTFSSHMTNIVSILQGMDEQSLVLLDELGAGTDPTEGAALAMAILEQMIQDGVKVIATTHYSELKSFAYNHERVENASVEFDVQTLQPTYRLLTGVPGKSNAFEISRRLGLSADIVERARGFLSREEVRVADLIENLETNQLLSEKDRREAEDLKRMAKGKLLELEKKEKELAAKSRQVLQKAKDEALEIVAKARRESESSLKELRTSLKNAPSLQEELGEMQKIRDSLRHKENELREETKSLEKGETIDIRTLEPGDMVIIDRLNQKAQVLQKPKNDEEVLVQAGIMKLTVKARDLRKIPMVKEKEEHVISGVGGIVAGKAREIKSELDLRGLTVDEALAETEKYLDDACLAGLLQAYLIHGKGTGALRAAITELVKTHHNVKSHRMGGYNEGGHGVTVVEFKK